MTIIFIALFIVSVIVIWNTIVAIDAFLVNFKERRHYNSFKREKENQEKELWRKVSNKEFKILTFKEILDYEYFSYLKNDLKTSISQVIGFESSEENLYSYGPDFDRVDRDKEYILAKINPIIASWTDGILDVDTVTSNELKRFVKKIYK